MGEMCDSLNVRGTLDGPVAGLVPVLDRLVCQARLGGVVRQKLGLAVRKLGKALTECCGDRAVQLLALCS